MDKTIDKAVIFLLCTVFYLDGRTGAYIVVPLICVVIMSALMSYLDDGRISAALSLGYLALCVFRPAFLFFLPFVCYDVFSTKYAPWLALAILPAGAGFRQLPMVSCVLILLTLGLSLLARRRTVALGRLSAEYRALRDSTKELSLLLERQNKDLVDGRDYELHLARLSERNRIARDIHDSVGHVLSASILQTGALLATCRDGEMAARLRSLRETLTKGMETVRESVHDLHDESTDLYAELRGLCDGFDFCAVDLTYDMDGQPDREVKYALLSVVREALSNVMRHSDATRVTVRAIEHPAFYQLAVRDNGSRKERQGGGIGLMSIEQRVRAAGGIVNIGYHNGFSVFVSIPKTAREGEKA